MQEAEGAPLDPGSAAVLPLGTPSAAVKRHPWWPSASMLNRNPALVMSAAFAVVLCLVALFPGVFASADPYEMRVEQRLLPPSARHWLGTDDMGRDLYSRIVHGAHLSLRTALIVVAVASAIGTALGGIAAYFGRAFDETIMRCVDVVISFPPLIMALALVAVLGPGLEHSSLALAVIWWPQYARLARGMVFAVGQSTFVEAAIASGLGRWRILFRHILPNCWGPLLVKSTLDIGHVILLTAALSFIGLGAKPPAPEWGALITTGRHYLLDHWWYPTFPGMVIFLAVMAFNLLGDGLRDVLDIEE